MQHAITLTAAEHTILLRENAKVDDAIRLRNLVLELVLAQHELPATTTVVGLNGMTLLVDDGAPARAESSAPEKPALEVMP